MRGRNSVCSWRPERRDSGQQWTRCCFKKLTQASRLPLAEKLTSCTQRLLLLPPKLGHQLTERRLAAPGHAGWLLNPLFNVSRKHSAFEVSGSCGQQDTLGCQSKLRTMEWMGFLMCLLTTSHFQTRAIQTEMSRAHLPCSANLFSEGPLDESGHRLILRITRVGFQTPSF